MRTRVGAWGILLALFLTVCQRESSHVFEYDVMGTFCRITVKDLPKSHAASAAESAFGRIAGVDSLMSIYKPDSEFSRINRTAGMHPQIVSPETFHILVRSKQFFDLTRGAFDISIGPLMSLWRFRSTGHVPEQAEIDSTLRFVGLQNMHIFPEDRSVELPSGMRLDSGGIAKGYAVDLAREALLTAGVGRGMIDLGGNLALIGNGPTQEGFWRIGVRSPLQRDETLCVLMVRDVALATSGQYEQYFMWNGKRYGHLLDPRTGRPADELLSVTIVAHDGLTADALSTGIFVLGLEEGLALLERLPDVEGILVTDPGSGNPLTRDHMVVTSGLSNKIVWSAPS